MGRDRYRRYLRAAKRKHADPAAILEVAEAEQLAPKQLAQIVGVLADRHGYKLPKGKRDPLLDSLLEAGMGAKSIADRLGCSPRTVARRQAAQVGVTDRTDKRGERDKTGSRDPRPTKRLTRAHADTYLAEVGREWVDPADIDAGTRPRAA